ncbi:MAG: 50S ribosomal protein L34e [Candidatus Diapherotrites archaeon]
MTKPHEMTMKKKFTRTIRGKVKISYCREKSSKHHCAICRGILHGTAHSKGVAEVSKLSKTQKRPSVIFGGVLCTKCRKAVMEDSAKVISEVKDINDVNLKRKKYVDVIVNRK